jgi:lipopolysaccharide/colanic/teichoic acid biosynthesis glycosyltransferase
MGRSVSAWPHFSYIQNRSFLLNIYILLQTIPVFLAKKGW